jgi:Rrf2 family protein
LNPITRSSEYAIRALTFLAQQPADAGYVLVRDMARRLDIPAPFLGKILQPLVARELVHSQRGRKGGFRLNRRPEEITLYQVVDALEFLTGSRACFLGQAECSDERACPMHTYWKAAAEGFEQRLVSTSLADVVRFCDERPHSGYPLPEPLLAKPSLERPISRNDP